MLFARHRHTLHTKMKDNRKVSKNFSISLCPFLSYFLFQRKHTHTHKRKSIDSKVNMYSKINVSLVLSSVELTRMNTKSIIIVKMHTQRCKMIYKTVVTCKSLSFYRWLTWTFRLFLSFTWYFACFLSYSALSIEQAEVSTKQEKSNTGNLVTFQSHLHLWACFHSVAATCATIASGLASSSRLKESYEYTCYLHIHSFSANTAISIASV